MSETKQQTSSSDGLKVVVEGYPGQYYLVPERNLAEWFRIRAMPYPEMPGGKFPSWVQKVDEVAGDAFQEILTRIVRSC